MNEEYRRMQADMFNLYPAIGEVNGRRSTTQWQLSKERKESLVNAMLK